MKFAYQIVRVFVDIEPDDFEDGCLGGGQVFDLPASKENHPDLQSVVKELSDLYPVTDILSNYDATIISGNGIHIRLDTGCPVNVKNCAATDQEIEEWETGNGMLWYASVGATIQRVVIEEDLDDLCVVIRASGVCGCDVIDF